MTYRFRKLLSILLALALLLACVPAVIAEGDDPAQPADPTGTVQDSMPADESADTELPADAAVNEEAGDPTETAGGEGQPTADEEQPAAEDELSPTEDEQSAPEEEQPTPAAGEPAAPAEEDLKQDSEPEQVKDSEPEQEIVSEEIVIDDELAQEETPVANTPEEEPHTPAETPAGENGAAEETELPVQETEEPKEAEGPGETETPTETEEPKEESDEPDETEESEEDYIELYLGSTRAGVLLPGEPVKMKLEAKVWANVLFTITLEPKAADENIGSIRAWIDDREQELIQVENEDPDSKAVIYTFEKRINKGKEYIITLKSNSKISYQFTPVRLPEPDKNAENETEQVNEETTETSKPGKETTGEAELSDALDQTEEAAASIEEAKQEIPTPKDEEAADKTEVKLLPDEATLLAMGYTKATVVKKNGASIYTGMTGDKASITVDYGTEYWLKPTSNAEWAAIYSDEETNYIKWDDVLLIIQKETGEEETQLPVTEEVFEKAETETTEDANLATEAETEETPEETEEKTREITDDIQSEETMDNAESEEKAGEESEGLTEPVVRSLIMSSSIQGKVSVGFGTQVLLRAEPVNFLETDRYTCQWRYSKDGINYVDIEGANGLTYEYSYSMDNYYYRWQIVIVIDDDSVE